jgi:non-homologous end joining protein Ku
MQCVESLFKFSYFPALRSFLEAKSEAPQHPKQSNVVNLMDALRQSLEKQGSAPRKKPIAPSTRRRAPARRPPRRKAS